MVQKESQATLEERESELSSNSATTTGASLEPPAAPATGEDNPAGTGGAAVAGAAGGARRFLCGVVEGERGDGKRVFPHALKRRRIPPLATQKPDPTRLGRGAKSAPKEASGLEPGILLASESYHFVP
ncbi:hypothetical protein P7K49_024330 [Saguinus oedipus]|uniref:Uncharacterized protein n=1 Tax=Saguinus oedipus TaxID=9490 RepID=A0ABQ9UP74_SAGOE|nr:hypothetical protein P7K49_024330 [Saguinus oedipus]